MLSIMQNRQRKTVGAELKRRQLFKKGKKPNKFTYPRKWKDIDFLLSKERPSAIAGGFSLAKIKEKRRLSVIGKPSFSVMVLKPNHDSKATFEEIRFV